MNLKVEEILMVIVAFLIGWFLRTMMSGSSIGSGSRVKAVGGKHQGQTNYDENSIFTKNECLNLIGTNRNDNFEWLSEPGSATGLYNIDDEKLGHCISQGTMIYRTQFQDLE